MRGSALNLKLSATGHLSGASPNRLGHRRAVKGHTGSPAAAMDRRLQAPALHPTAQWSPAENGGGSTATATGDRRRQPPQATATGNRRRQPSQTTVAGNRRRQPSQATVAGNRRRQPSQATAAGNRRRQPSQATAAGNRNRQPPQATVAGNRRRQPSQATATGNRHRQPSAAGGGGAVDLGEVGPNKSFSGPSEELQPQPTRQAPTSPV
ncbi:unnamed protein product [Boreogadus saida]